MQKHRGWRCFQGVVKAITQAADKVIRSDWLSHCAITDAQFLDRA